MTVLAGKSVGASLGFSVEGLSARDELLVKSLVRLLGHRTLQQWVFQANPIQASLRILDAETAPAQVGFPSAAPVLLVGRSDPGRGPFLRLPPHADEFERILNQLGAEILQARVQEPAEQELAPAESRPVGGGSFRLLRWPPAVMLGTPWRTKLATLMVGQALPIDLLHQRSGVSLAECTAFMRELQQAGLLREAVASGVVVAPASQAPAPVISAPTTSVEVVVQPLVPFLPTVAAPKAPPGLLARIRARLGFQTGQ